MASWRDHVPPQAQSTSTVDGPGVPVRQADAARHGEFFPYAVGVSQLGECGCSPPNPEPVSSRSRPTCCRTSARVCGQSETHCAVALTSDVRVADSRDPRELEHSEGIAISVLLRYHHRNGAGSSTALSAIPAERRSGRHSKRQRPPSSPAPRAVRQHRPPRERRECRADRANDATESTDANEPRPIDRIEPTLPIDRIEPSIRWTGSTGRTRSTTARCDRVPQRDRWTASVGRRVRP